jgi:hypothetical protein
VLRKLSIYTLILPLRILSRNKVESLRARVRLPASSIMTVGPMRTGRCVSTKSPDTSNLIKACHAVRQSITPAHCCAALMTTQMTRRVLRTGEAQPTATLNVECPMTEIVLTTNPNRMSNYTLSVIVRSVGQGRFSALLQDRLLCQSRTPLLSAARVLQAEGIPDDMLLEMVHEGSATVALRATLGVAAGLRVSETGSMPRFVPWRPDQLPRASPTACTVESLGGKAIPPRPQTPPTKEQVSKASLQQACATEPLKWLRCGRSHRLWKAEVSALCRRSGGTRNPSRCERFTVK